MPREVLLTFWVLPIYHMFLPKIHTIGNAKRLGFGLEGPSPLLGPASAFGLYHHVEYVIDFFSAVGIISRSKL